MSDGPPIVVDEAEARLASLACTLIRNRAFSLGPQSFEREDAGALEWLGGSQGARRGKSARRSLRDRHPLLRGGEARRCNGCQGDRSSGHGEDEPGAYPDGPENGIRPSGKYGSKEIVVACHQVAPFATRYASQ